LPPCSQCRTRRGRSQSPSAAPSTKMPKPLARSTARLGMISVKVSASWLRREAVPNAQTIGVIVDPDSPDTIQQMKDLTAAASAVGRRLKIVSARSGSDIDAAFATMAEQKVGAVVVTSAPIYFAQREKLVGIAARYAIPTVFFCARLCRCRRPDELRHQLSRRQSSGRRLYRPNPQRRQVADLPVQQSVKVELVINLKTAKSLGPVDAAAAAWPGRCRY